MALVDCPECGDRISTISPQCPNCGHVLSEEAAAIQKDPAVPTAAPPPVAPAASGASPRSQSNWVVGLAVAAVVAVILAVVAAAILLAGSVSISNPSEDSGAVDDASTQSTVATETSASAPTTATTIAITDDGFGLSVGDCLDAGELDLYIVGESYNTTPCADPHDYEVYFLYEYADGPFPGDNEVDDELAAACEDEFEGYVGRDYESSSLNIYRLWPASDLWESGGRIGECLMFDIDSKKLTGSAYQSGW